MQALNIIYSYVVLCYFMIAWSANVMSICSVINYLQQGIKYLPVLW